MSAQTIQIATGTLDNTLVLANLNLLIQSNDSGLLTTAVGSYSTKTLTLDDFGVTASSLELSQLTGYAGSVADLNSVTQLWLTEVTYDELQHLHGFLGSVEDFNFLHEITTAGITLNDLIYAQNTNLSGVTPDELSKLQGYTGSSSGLNFAQSLYSSGVTLTELYKLHGFSGDVDTLNYLYSLSLMGTTAAEFATLHGFTGTTTDLNYAQALSLTGVTATEFNSLQGITSNIQEQLDSKISTIGNMALADQLRHARSIELAGAVTGSAMFDGSTNITINTVLEDITDISAIGALTDTVADHETRLVIVEGQTADQETRITTNENDIVDLKGQVPLMLEPVHIWEFNNTTDGWVSTDSNDLLVSYADGCLVWTGGNGHFAYKDMPDTLGSEIPIIGFSFKNTTLLPTWFGQVLYQHSGEPGVWLEAGLFWPYADQSFHQVILNQEDKNWMTQTITSIGIKFSTAGTYAVSSFGLGTRSLLHLMSQGIWIGDYPNGAGIGTNGVAGASNDTPKFYLTGQNAPADTIYPAQEAGSFKIGNDIRQELSDDYYGMYLTSAGFKIGGANITLHTGNYIWMGNPPDDGDSIVSGCGIGDSGIVGYENYTSTPKFILSAKNLTVNGLVPASYWDTLPGEVRFGDNVTADGVDPNSANYSNNLLHFRPVNPDIPDDEGYFNIRINGKDMGFDALEQTGVVFYQDEDISLATWVLPAAAGTSLDYNVIVPTYQRVLNDIDNSTTVFLGNFTTLALALENSGVNSAHTGMWFTVDENGGESYFVNTDFPSASNPGYVTKIKASAASTVVDLATTYYTTKIDITNTAGTNATINAATPVSAGVLSPDVFNDITDNTNVRHSAVTVLDSSEIDFTLNDQQITANIIAGSIDETKLDTSVNASLDLADSSLQNSGNLTESTSSVLTITNGTDAVVGSGTSIQVKQASTSTSGYLSSTDWNIFNNKADSFTKLTSNLDADGFNIYDASGYASYKTGTETFLNIANAPVFWNWNSQNYTNNVYNAEIINTSSQQANYAFRDARLISFKDNDASYTSDEANHQYRFANALHVSASSTDSTTPNYTKDIVGVWTSSIANTKQGYESRGCSGIGASAVQYGYGVATNEFVATNPSGAHAQAFQLQGIMAIVSPHKAAYNAGGVNRQYDCIGCVNGSDPNGDGSTADAYEASTVLRASGKFNVGLDFRNTTISGGGIALSRSTNGSIIEYDANDYSLFSSNTFQWVIGGSSAFAIDSSRISLEGTDTAVIFDYISNPTRYIGGNSTSLYFVHNGASRMYWNASSNVWHFQGHRLYDVGYPSGSTDAATKGYADTKAPIASPSLTGTPTAPTATVGTNTTQIATTAFVLANAGSSGVTNPLTTHLDCNGFNLTLSTTDVLEIGNSKANGLVRVGGDLNEATLWGNDNTWVSTWYNGQAGMRATTSIDIGYGNTPSIKLYPNSSGSVSLGYASGYSTVNFTCATLAAYCTTVDFNSSSINYMYLGASSCNIFLGGDRIKTNSTGIGFFGHSPVSRHTFNWGTETWNGSSTDATILRSDINRVQELLSQLLACFGDNSLPYTVNSNSYSLTGNGLINT